MGNSSENYKAYGLPIMLISVFIVSILISRKQLLHTWTMAQYSPSLMVLVWGSLICGILSIFLFFTTAWGYGLISTSLCYGLALVSSGAGIQARVRDILWVLCIWFAILIGIPSPFTASLTSSTSIISVVSASCKAYYGAASDAMCKAGWLTFSEIVATLVIALNFLALLTVLSFAIGNESIGSDGSYEPVAEGPVVEPAPATASHYGSSPSAPISDYRKVP